MATRMYLGNSLIYSSDGTFESYIIGPKLKLELGKAGTLEFTIIPSDEHYNQFEKMKSVITVVYDGTLIFRGRVLSMSSDFFKQKQIQCEGDLSFLLDSIFEPYKGTKTVSEMFSKIIDGHNSQMGDESYKKFTVGNVTVPDASGSVNFDITSFEDSSSTIESELIDSFGGILQTRTVSGTTYIDYLADPHQNINSYAVNTQPIAFGVNLLDIECEPPVDDVFTILLPIGKDKDTTIKSVNDNSKFLENPLAIAKYGRIVRCEQWSDISSASNLKTKAQEFLNVHSVIYPDDISVKALDLHLLDPANHPRLMLGDRIRCYSEPHDIDITLVCLEIEWDISNPENNTYKIGTFVPSDEHDGNKIVKKKKSGKKKTKKLSGLTTKNSKDSEKNKLRVSADTELMENGFADINAREIRVGTGSGDIVSINNETIDLTGLVANLVDGRIYPT